MAAPETDKHGFIQSLGLLDSTTFVVGSMIGSGIFIVAADVLRQLGSPGWLILAWVLAGILTVTAAISYGELAAMMPEAGGQYVYLNEAYSPLWGFLYGWSLFLVVQTGEIAAVAVAFARYFGTLFTSGAGENDFLFNFGTLGPLSLSLSMGQVVACVVIIVLTAINTMGVKSGKAVQNVFSIAKTAALLGIILLGIFFAGRNPQAAIHQQNFWTPLKADGSALTGIAFLLVLCTALVGPLFSHDAWNNITFIAPEVKRPHRNIPLGLLFGTACVMLLYCSVNMTYVSVLSTEQIQHAPSDRVATLAVSAVLGSKATIVMALAIMISTFGAINGMVLAGARVYYTMAKKGFFFKSAGDLNKNSVPAKGLILQGVWSCLLVLPRTYDPKTGEYGNLYASLLNYVVLVALIFYALTVGGIFVLRRKRPDLQRPYKAWGYPYLQALYVCAALGIALVLLVSEQTRMQAIAGLIIVLSGLPVYWLWKHRKQSA
jgi:basic amino acid/polyamine antiporter, APA family